MADILHAYDFRPPGNNGDSHPWVEWFDGRIWRLRRGHDFVRAVRVFANTARHAARRRGLLLTLTIESESVVVLRATPKGAG